MSGVATLKARGVKRALDEMVVEPACRSPGRAHAHALRPHAARGALKRTRLSPPPPSAMARLPASAPASSTGTSGKVERLSADELAALARHVPKRLKKVVSRLAAGASHDERLFTAADVRAIVTSVCAEREAQLKGDFQNTLDEALAEQFRTFSRYNEDFIARKMRDRDCSYLS